MIGPEPPPCHEEDPSGSTQGPTYETWTDREYVYHAAAGAQLDEFILQIDRTGAPMYMLQDAGLNVVGLVDQSGDIILQDTYAPYGEVVATDLFNLSFGHNHAGWKGLFFDRLVANAQGSQLTPGGVGLYRARNRTYSSTLGRWLQRDPFGSGRPVLEHDPLTRRAARSEDDCCGPGGGGLAFEVDAQYFDGMNAFLFARGNSVVGTDPLGLSIGILVGIGFDLNRAARDAAAGVVVAGLATLVVARAWEWVKATEIAITLTDADERRRRSESCYCMCIADDPSHPGQTQGPFPIRRMATEEECKLYPFYHPEYVFCYCK